MTDLSSVPVGGNPSTGPGFALRCGQCTLRPDPNAEMGMFGEHFKAEHPVEFEAFGVQMTLIIVCLQCKGDDGVPPQCEQGWRDTLWICPSCGHRRNVSSKRR